MPSEQEEFEALLNGEPAGAEQSIPEGAELNEAPSEAPIDETPPPEAKPAPSEPSKPPNSAFAAMRAKNAKLEATLERLASVKGLDFKASPDEAIQALEASLSVDQAKALGTTPEFLARLQKQDEILRSVVEAEETRKVTNAFAAVMNQCQITPEETYAFAEELNEVGIDVKGNLDVLPALYRGLHFDRLTEKKVNAAVQDALTRAVKSAGSSTTPNPAQGKGGIGGSDPIETQEALDKVLRELS